MPSQGTFSARHNTGNKLVNIRKSALPEPCDAVYQETVWPPSFGTAT